MTDKERAEAEKAKAAEAEKEKAAAAPTAPTTAEKKKADAKAEEARKKAIASPKFLTNHPVGEHAQGKVVDRSKFGSFKDDEGKPDEAAYDENLGRLLDLGAISPAPDDKAD